MSRAQIKSFFLRDVNGALKYLERLILSQGNIAKITETQRDALTPSEGYIIYNTTSHKYNFYNGSDWEEFTSS